MLDSQVMDVSASGGWLTRRSLNVLGFLICASGLGYAYYAQFVQGFEPCPLCIFQRLALAAVGLVFLAAAVHHPRDWGAKVYGVLIDLVATVGVVIAAQLVWPQLNFHEWLHFGRLRPNGSSGSRRRARPASCLASRWRCPTECAPRSEGPCT